MSGIEAEQTERLKREVRYETARGPKCFRWIMDKSSGPTAEDDLAILIASIVAALSKRV